MKILNFGSLNIDHLYNCDHFVQEKETMIVDSYSVSLGGKGFNQSIALAKAGLEVYHACILGKENKEFLAYFKNVGVNCNLLKVDNNLVSGHAIIENCKGENRIIVYGGSNQEISNEYIDEVFDKFDGEYLLIQNETNNLDYIIQKAKEKNMYIIFNLAPMNEKVFTYPLDMVDMLVVNEVEASALCKCGSDYQEIISKLKEKYFDKEIILTLGKDGSYYINKEEVVYQDIYEVETIDSTAAGDCFIGYFLSEYLISKNYKKGLDIASKASSLCVSKMGSSNSIPTKEEIELYFNRG